MLALLAAEPDLASRLPPRAGRAPAHWAAHSVALFPALEALLRQGACAAGRAWIDGGLRDIPHCSETPLEWAILAGNFLGVAALLKSGARAGPSDLLLACLLAQGRCALELLESAGAEALRPFERQRLPQGFQGPDASAWEAICDASERLLDPISEPRRMVAGAKARLEALWLEESLRSAQSGSERERQGRSGRL